MYNRNENKSIIEIYIYIYILSEILKMIDKKYISLLKFIIMALFHKSSL